MLYYNINKYNYIIMNAFFIKYIQNFTKFPAGLHVNKMKIENKLTGESITRLN